MQEKMLLISSYLSGIGTELKEAAQVDGANLFQTMFLIMFPVCRPVIMTIVILTFMHTWNEFPFARVLYLFCCKNVMKGMMAGAVKE